MSNQRTTPWYPPEVLPCADRPGRYQRYYGSESDDLTGILDRWDGEQWWLVEKNGNEKKSSVWLPWRGLTRKSAE